MNQLLLNVAIVLALILLEGVFVAAEIALVSLRDGQVRAMAGTRRGDIVVKLVADPNRFLAAVQIGVTSTALLSSAFGAVTISGEVRQYLIGRGWSEGLASATGVVGVTLIITFVTLVVGELVPKRLGLQRAEPVARLMAPPLSTLARVMRPVIWALSKCTNVLVRLLGGDPKTGREEISEAELRDLVAVHEALSTDERRLIDEVFAARTHNVSEVMVSRTEVTFLEAGQTISRATTLAFDAPHSRYPVIGESQDDVRGFVHVRDLLASRGERVRTVGDVAREVKFVPGSKNVLVALSEMRREGHHLAIVVDEYGGTDGIVTLEDLIEEVIGDIRDEYDEADAGVQRLVGGVVELDGNLNLTEFEESTGLELPEGPYETAAGYVMSVLGRVPLVGDEVVFAQHRLRVIELDGRRVSRLRVTPHEPVPVPPA